MTVQQGELLSLAENTVVSPANSSGFMDGGIDRAFVAFFGSQLQERVQDTIIRRPEGHLPVGASVVVRTGHARIPYLIVAPTMLGPEAVVRTIATGRCEPSCGSQPSSRKWGSRFSVPVSVQVSGAFVLPTQRPRWHEHMLTGRPSNSRPR